MIKQISLIVMTSVALLTLSNSTLASEQAVQPAKLVVYRADEASKTTRVKFQVRVDQTQIGKLKYENAIVTNLAPGTYSLDTTLRGTKPLEVELKPGQTYFIYTRMNPLGHKLTPVLELVEEKVAVSHQPSISSVI